MGINVTDAGQLASLYQSILNDAGVEGVTVTASEDGKGLVVTAPNAEGVNVETFIAVPEIDAPEAGTVGNAEAVEKFNQAIAEILDEFGGFDDATLEAVEERLNQLLETVAAQDAAGSTSGSSKSKMSALYSIYKLMSLLLECTREQREISRSIRATDTKMLINEMEGQRQKMIDDAVAGLIGAAVVAVVQLGMITVSAVLDYKSSNMKKDATLASGEDAFRRINALSTKVDDQTAMDTAKKSAESRLTAAINKINAGKEQPAEQSNAMKQINDRFDEIEDMQVTDENGAVVQNPTQQQLADLAAKKADARTKVFEDIKAERKIASNEFYDEYKQTGEVTPEMRQKMELANAKMEYAATCKFAAEAGNPLTDKAESFRRSLQISYGHARYNSTNGPMAPKIANFESKSNTYSNVTTVMSDLARNLLTYGIELRKADTRQWDEAVEYSREQRDSSKDLVSEMLEAFKQVLNVLKSVQETENRTFQEIMA